MRTSVRKELNRIEKFLSKNNAASADLWAILTALRGPDDDRGKKEGTIPVRRKAFPGLAKSGGVGSIPASFDGSSTIKWAAVVNNHFLSHIERAKVAFLKRGK